MAKKDETKSTKTATKKSTAKSVADKAKKVASNAKSRVKKVASTAKKAVSKKAATKKTATTKTKTKKTTAKSSPAKKATASKAKTTKKSAVRSKSTAKKATQKKVASKTKSSTKATVKKKVTTSPTSKTKAKSNKKPAQKAKATPAKAKAAQPAKSKTKKSKVKTTKSVAASKSTQLKSANDTQAGKPKPLAYKPTRRIDDISQLPPTPKVDAMAAPVSKRMLWGNIPPYEPAQDEEYMSPNQLSHFLSILKAWKQELMEEMDRTVNHMKDESANLPDPADRATQEEEFSLELRTRDRERKLIKKIDSTLRKIVNDEDYGYCAACGVEVGLRRLEARPTAELCIDCKTLDEIKERQTRL